MTQGTEQEQVAIRAAGFHWGKSPAGFECWWRAAKGGCVCILTFEADHWLASLSDKRSEHVARAWGTLDETITRIGKFEELQECVLAEFPDIGVRLPRDQWLALMLRLANRDLSARHKALANAAEAAILRQLSGIQETES